jgi:MFS family permease
VNVSLVALTLPAIVMETVGVDQKGLHLGLITAAGALISIAVVYAIGGYGDRNRARQGRRRYPLYGLLLLLAPLAVLLFDVHYALIVAAVTVIFVARSVIESSHLPLLVEYGGFGATSRYTAAIAFYQILGAGGGALVFSEFAFVRLAGGGVASILAATAVAVVLVALLGYGESVRRMRTLSPVGGPSRTNGDGTDSPSLSGDDTPGFYLSHELRLLLTARLFFLAGVFIVSTYLVFVVADVMQAADVSGTAGRLFATAVVGGLLFALPSRVLTERLGEIDALLLAGAVLAAAAALFVLAGGRLPWIATAAMVFYGAGFSTVVSAGLSLTVGLVPRPELAGRIMAVVVASTFAAQFLASMIGAVVLDPLNRVAGNSGYYALLASTEICFALGAVFLLRLKSLRALPERASPHPRDEQR